MESPAAAGGATSSPAAAPSGIGPYELAVTMRTADGDRVMQVTVTGSGGPATVGDVKTALLSQTVAAKENLLRAPLRLVELKQGLQSGLTSRVLEPASRQELTDDGAALTPVWTRQQEEGGLWSLVVENAPAPTAAAAPVATLAPYAATPTQPKPEVKYPRNILHKLEPDFAS